MTIAGCDARKTPLLAIKFDNQLFVDRHLNFVALGQRNDAPGIIVAIDLQPGGRVAVAGCFFCRLKNGQLTAGLADCNLVTGIHRKRRDIDLFPVHMNMAVTHQLPRLATGNSEAHTEDDVVETALELLQKDFTGNALRRRGLFEIVAKLAFLREIHALGLLLFAQLQAVADDLRLAVFTVLTGGKVTLLDGALVAETASAFEEQLHAFATAKATDRISVSGHLLSLIRCPVYGYGFTLLPGLKISQFRVSDFQTRNTKLVANYTRRRFGGRQPLCGIGVESLIVRTSMPEAARARIADSRPEPGPLTRTSTLRTPWSRAMLAAFEAACWAANGVPLRDPRKPSEPELFQESTLPAGSEIVTIVLLKDA